MVITVVILDQQDNRCLILTFLICTDISVSVPQQICDLQADLGLHTAIDNGSLIIWRIG